jgi:hypothetical protein
MRLLQVSALCMLVLAPAALAAPSNQEACVRIGDMLFETQLRQRDFNPVEYALIDKTLKDTYLARCESGSGLEPSDNYSNGLALFRDGAWLLPNGEEHSPSLLMDAASSAPILQSFLRAHRACARGCSYVSWGIWGDSAHQRRASCHNSGQAIDIHAITCRGRQHAAPSDRFSSYVSCMRGYLGVIYKSKDHFNHAHFQLRGCNKCVGQGCSGGKGKGGGKKRKKALKPSPRQDHHQDQYEEDDEDYYGEHDDE